jgi:chemotaxis protein MotA
MKRGKGLDGPSLLGLPLAVAVVVLAQVVEGGSVRSLWQPTAAMVVFGGTAAAVLVSCPLEAVLQTFVAAAQAFRKRSQARQMEATVGQLLRWAIEARRRGIVALEPELDRTREGFLRNALTLAVDGTHPNMARHILEIESHAHRVVAEAPADVLETAAGYTPTLGILGAVLGLIHVMENLSEPAKLGSGIAVAFVATVYGVGVANLILLPLATRLRSLARDAALHRELIIEGVVALQEGLNPRLVEQKLQGFVTPARERARPVRAA